MRIHDYDTHTLPSGSTVAIYGAGERGRIVCEDIRSGRNDVDVHCFLNSFEDGRFNGLPNFAIGNAPEVDLILIASTFVTDIILELARRNVPDTKFGVYVLPKDFFPRQCMVSHEHQFIYVTVNKIAHTSFKQAFAEFAENGVQNLDFTESRYDGYYKFAFTRCPYRRLISMYNDKIQRKKYLEYFNLITGGEPSFGNILDALFSVQQGASDAHWLPQSHTLCRADDSLVVDRIYRLESLDAALDELRDRLGIAIHMPVANKSRKQLSFANLSSRQKSAIFHYYRRDFKNLDYAE